MRLPGELARFVFAGAVGFVVDAGVLYGVLAQGLGYYSGRALSFFAAVLATWLINRRWTFSAASARPTLAEFLRYFGAMSIGGAINYAAYALVIGFAPRNAWLPLAAVGVGSATGLGVNFVIARIWVFGRVTGRRRAPP